MILPSQGLSPERPDFQACFQGLTNFVSTTTMRRSWGEYAISTLPLKNTNSQGKRRHSTNIAVTQTIEALDETLYRHSHQPNCSKATQCKHRSLMAYENNISSMKGFSVRKQNYECSKIQTRLRITAAASDYLQCRKETRNEFHPLNTICIQRYCPVVLYGLTTKECH